MKKLLTMSLQEIYLDYFNNFLTTAKMAEHYEIDIEDMKALISIGSKYYKLKFD